MIEATALASAATRLRERRAPILVATVVRTQGSSYRRPGARLVATAEGRVAGSVSGGCLERDLIRTGFWRSRSGPVVVRYDSLDVDEGERVLGCGGIVDVLLEQGVAGADSDPLSWLVAAVGCDEPATIATAIETTDATIPLGARWVLTARELVAASHREARAVIAALASAVTPERPSHREIATERGRVTLLVEPVVPTPHLFIFGDGADVLPLIVIARSLGWTVTVWSAVHSFETRSRLAGAGACVETRLEAMRAGLDAGGPTMAVIMGHALSRDRAALEAAVASRAIYIGVLGPRHRTASLARDLPEGLLSDPRVHSPVGLDLGAETPEEIALSIASELLAVARRASGQALRRRSSIHDDAA
ncbi:MAG: XdhC family protein [Labilithrix sp.]|nr:XdhC family protein [Labilithrix sp.]